MKILYAVQATGNGHISRAVSLMPTLEKLGQVDVFLSGSNAQLQVPLPVRFRSRGLSLHYAPNGGLHYGKIVRQFNPKTLFRDVQDLPVERYDVVLNDFECITAMACARKKVRSIGLGHQAAFQSDRTPRPKRRELMGEQLLRYYGKASQYLGFHFDRYDDFIHPPVIKPAVLAAQPKNKGHVTVYLPAYADLALYDQLRRIPRLRFEVFSRTTKTPYQAGNIHFFPVQYQAFTESMVSSCGVITSAGFETPAETIFLGKPLMVIPIKGQYEQACNAAAMAHFGVQVIHQINDSFASQIEEWLASARPRVQLLSPLSLSDFAHVLKSVF